MPPEVHIKQSRRSKAMSGVSYWPFTYVMYGMTAPTKPLGMNLENGSFWPFKD